MHEKEKEIQTTVCLVFHCISFCDLFSFKHLKCLHVSSPGCQSTFSSVQLYHHIYKTVTVQ